MYDHVRFFTMTGDHLEGTALRIEPRQAELDAFHAQVWPERHQSPSGAQRADGHSASPPLEDDALMERALQAGNGEKLARLFAGDISDYPSQSEADLALCGLLAFWTQDAEQIDKLFRRSRLYRDKWDERHYADGRTYGEVTVEKALENLTASYTGRKTKTAGKEDEPLNQEPHQERAKITLQSAAELMNTNIPDPQWAIPGLLVEGLTLFAGPPKIGKSWFSLSLALSISRGTLALGKFSVEPGAVLYLALEDGPVRMKDRLDVLVGETQWPCTLLISYEAPTVGDGLEDQLTALLDEHSLRLIVIDTLVKVRPYHRSRRGSMYQDDYHFAAPLQRFALKHHISVLAVHHTRKMESMDPLELVSGSNGLTGSADATLVLTRGRGMSDAVLLATGRDQEERTLALTFDSGIWSFVDEPKARLAPTRERIIGLLTQADTPLAPKDIAKAIGLDHNLVKQTLRRMAKDGQVHAIDGKYTSSHPSHHTSEV